jgi:GMP synthase (glutamine-hydrolysing)
MSSPHQLVLVLDFGSQYTQLIARRVRELGVFCEVVPFHAGLAAARSRTPVGIILSGGPDSVYAEGAPQAEPRSSASAYPCSGSATACSS